MSKPIRSFLSFLLVLQLIIPYSTFAAAVGEFTSVVGNVKQTRAKELITPVAKSPIELKDIIATARTSSATMVLSDESKITLSENTKLEIKEFLFKDKSRRGIFSLAIGKLTADVRKYIGGDNVFEVNSPTVAVGVRGTGFEFVEAMKDGNVDPNLANQQMATVTCTDGSLNLSSLSATGEVISTAVLEAGQVAVIIGGIITISKIGAVVAAALAAKTTGTGAAGTAGGTGTGGAAAAGSSATTATAAGSGTTVAAGGASGGAAAAGTTAAAAGTATAATGLSTAAIAGASVGAVAAVGVTAAAIAGSGGGGSSSSSSSSTQPTTTTTPTTTPKPCSDKSGKWSGMSSGKNGCGEPDSGTWTFNVSADCSVSVECGSNCNLNCSISGNNMTCSALWRGSCGGVAQECTGPVTGTFSGNTIQGTASSPYCAALSYTWTGTKQ